MKLLPYLIVLCTTLHAYTYNHQLMQVYAKIAPRLALMTQTPSSVEVHDIHLCIHYEAGDDKAAKRLRDTMLSIYPDGLGGRNLHISISPYKASHQCNQSALIFLLDTDIETMRPIILDAQKQHVPTMSYSNRFMANGVMLSLYLGKTVRPYLNVEAAKQSGITLDNLLVQISKIYTKEAAQ